MLALSFLSQLSLDLLCGLGLCVCSVDCSLSLSTIRVDRLGLSERRCARQDPE